jgi:hypothetical protein
MGNSENKNEKFNPNFNMAEYNEKLQSVQHQYRQNNINVQQTYNPPIRTENLNCK